ncbi:asparagine synthetase B family protein [Sphingomonas sp. SRS2]|uniref:asparagine synthetase B family protein n=1 Tax=Sphingomonas sp. SRS2 TaxID=133190 RepID=UPI000696B9CA|nr:asparagine synthase C-terminal domain-containing protein [Sphingomonas sp. SRS2]
MLWQLDEPLADPAPLDVLYISQLARTAGIKVLLSGVGGDDLFSGYRRHLAVSYDWLWSWMPAMARRGLAGLSRQLDQRTALGRRASRLFGNADGSEHMQLAKYFAWARRGDLHALYTPELNAAINDISADQPMLDHLRRMSPETSRLEKLLSLEQRFFLADHNLIYTDKMAMAASVEVRVPFLDPDLVDLAARIPGRFKQRGREGKWVLKKAMEPYLPCDVIYRPKSGFGAPLRLWLQGDLRPLMFDILSTDSLRARGLFDPVAVDRLIADNDAGRVDAAYTIFSLMCVEIWCRKFMGSNFSFEAERRAAMA